MRQRPPSATPTVTWFLPTLIVQLTGSTGSVAQWISTNFAAGTGTYYELLYFLLIVFFCYFYTAVTFNPVDVADNLKKFGGFIPGDAALVAQRRKGGIDTEGRAHS